MADYTMGAGDVAVHAKALLAGAEDTVALPATDFRDPSVFVHPGSASPVYVSLGASPATVGGPNCRVVWPGFALPLAYSTKVRLICASAAVYSVQVG